MGGVTPHARHPLWIVAIWRNILPHWAKTNRQQSKTSSPARKAFSASLLGCLLAGFCSWSNAKCSPVKIKLLLSLVAAMLTVASSSFHLVLFCGFAAATVKRTLIDSSIPRPTGNRAGWSFSWWMSKILYLKSQLVCVISAFTALCYLASPVFILVAPIKRDAVSVRWIISL